MNKVITSIFLVFFINMSVFALPGMSKVSYNFSLNSKLFSKDAIQCQTRNKSGNGLESLSEFMNKMNCNRLNDPDKFCQCVKSISSKGLDISDEEAKTIELVIEDVAREKVLGSLAKKIEKIDGYQDLLAILATKRSGEKCFKPTNQDDTFGDYLASRRKGKALSIKEELAGKILKKVRNDIQEIRPADLVDTITDARKIKDSILVNGNFKSAGIGLLQSKVDYDLKLFPWSEYEGSAIANLMKKDEKLIRVISDINSNNIANGKKMEKAFPSNMFSSYSPSTIRTKGYTDGSEDILIDSAIRSGCKIVKEKIDELIASETVEKNIESIKAAAFNPSEENNKIFKLIEKDLSNALKSKSGHEELVKVQEYTFNIDLLYCKDRLRSSEYTSTAEGDQIIEDIKDDVLTNSRKIQLIRKSIVASHKEYKRALDDYNVKAEKSRRRSNKIDLLNRILDGEFSTVVDGKVILDANNAELMRLASDADSNLASLINKGRKSLTGRVELKKSEIEESIVIEEETYSYNLKLLKKATRKVSELNMDVRAGEDSLRILNKERSKLMASLENKVGSTVASRIVAKADDKVDKELGLETSFDLISEYENNTIDIENIPSKSKSDINIEASNVVTDLAPAKVSELESVESPPVNTVAIDNDNYFKGTSIGSHIVPTKVIPINQQDMSVANKSDIKAISSNSSLSAREKELEQKLKELESLVSDNAQSANDSTQNSVDNSIEELKNKISIEKLKAEKLKVLNQINQIKNTSSSNIEATTPKVSSASTNYSALSPSQNFRGPSSSSKSNTVASSSESAKTSSFSSSNSSGASSVDSVASPAEAERTIGSRSQDSNISLTGNRSSLNTFSGDSSIELVSYNGEKLDSSTRLVKLDFNLDQENSEKQEKLLESLFVDGENEIIIETLEGEKIVVKNHIQKSEKGKATKKEKSAEELNHRKMRHKNLINLLKVGNIPE